MQYDKDESTRQTKSQYMHIRVPAPLLEQARAVAEVEGMTLSELMRYLLRKHVQQATE